ncbi:hypothetical protein JTB14_023944 [Gonioctena quinquepunctata]|nr:hypothetical protein JTB14_023944 [Gonioctena quinquepunctata]
MSSMTNTSVPSSFKKLEGKGNIDWKYVMEIHLIICELMEYVDGTKTNVETDFRAKSKRALAAIVSGVKTHISTKIRDMKTGKEVLDCLATIYEPKGFSIVAALMEHLVLIKYNECKCMDDYLSKKVKLAQQLKAIDHEIKDGVLAALIFVSIPDYYKPLIMALETMVFS